MRLKLRVIPNSSRNQIVGWYKEDTLKVKIAAPAEKGKANKELLKFLKKELKTDSSISLISGYKDRNKVVEFNKGKLPAKPLKLV